MQEQKGVYTSWVLLLPAEDVAGAWTAHALEFDVVTQGDSAEQAFSMAQEAVGIVLADDLRRGASPHARKAPADCWLPLLEIFESGAPVDRSTFKERLARPKPSEMFAVQMVWHTGHAPQRVSTTYAPVAFTTPNSAHC
jgi:predicted RNase H-like HicB family nuclease